MGERIVRNREGKTEKTQRLREREEKEKWTKEELEEEWEVDKIVQELEFENGRRWFRMQFKGFTKLSDAKWIDEEEMEEDYRGHLKDWRRRKKDLGTIERNKKEDGEVVGKFISIKRNR